ncbi:hypothetical protein MTYP_00519 [Methylophilaceae bacterium]|nr:hypothetical protein MTYP_00519 [Methylophilaceae bacterium]
MNCRILILLCGLISAWGAQAEERILDMRDGTVISREQLVQAIAGSDFILLGELHDSRHHHQRRGELLDSLNQFAPTLVAEHLEIGRTFVSSGNLQGDLEQAGFDAKGWRWPLHQPLFAAAVAADMPLLGGNIPRATAKNAVREGVAALPADLAELIAQAPLDPAAQDKLDADLLRGHCGYLDNTMLSGLRLAQRARDAAMFSALRGATTRPAVLVAGNGHVRRDYGVPSLIRRHLPDSRYTSIGFLEDTPKLQGDLAELAAQYDYLWITAPIERNDPCESFKSRK